MSSILLAGAKINYEMTKGNIEIKARGYGMRYPGDMPIISKEDVKKW